MLDSSGNFWQGHIAEVLIYDEALSPAKQREVEEYLREKYSLDPELPGVEGLGAWFRADKLTGLSDNDPVETWYDSSGKWRLAEQDDPDKQPVYKATGVAGRPSVRYDGTDGWPCGARRAFSGIPAAQRASSRPADQLDVTTSAAISSSGATLPFAT